MDAIFFPVHNMYMYEKILNTEYMEDTYMAECTWSLVEFFWLCKNRTMRIHCNHLLVQIH